jgi:DNA-binding NtrC family response regulator
MSLRILLIDDEKQFVGILAERLKFRGFNVRTALSGEEGLETLMEEAADVVILDIRMPGKNGIQILKEIKQMSPQTEVILLTGHASVETAIDGVKHGAFSYLVKPTDLAGLLDTINQAAERSRNNHLNSPWVS